MTGRFTYFLILSLFVFFTNQVLGAKKVVSLNIETEINIPDDFQIGMEEELTSYGYYLCQKDSCKSVPFQVKVNIIRKSENVYRFKAKFVDLKNKRVISIKSIYFKGSVKDYEKLMKIGKKLTKFIVENIKNNKITETSQRGKNKKNKEDKSSKVSSERRFNSLNRMEEMINKRQNLQELKPVQNKDNTDLFYDSVISHPQIINIR